MAIGNVTPDSFYAGSRLADEAQLTAWARQALSDGADLLDIGGCSTRPNAPLASTEEEWQRVEPALRTLRTALPDATLSLDTFRPEIARRALEQFGRMIINDVSGGCEEMFALIREWQVPYVFTCRQASVNVEKPIDFWLRKGKAVGETKPTESERDFIETLTRH